MAAAAGAQARVDRASRLMRAAPEQLFDAFVTREAVVSWLPPDGATAALDAFDPRPGGAFRMTLVFAPGPDSSPGKTSDHSDSIEGHFVEIVRPRFLCQQFSFVSHDSRFAGTMTMTWTLVPEPGGTLVTVTAENVPVGISPQDHQAGMKSSLANLARYVEGSGRADEPGKGPQS